MEAVLLHQLQISEPPSWGADSLDEHLVFEWEPFPPSSPDLWSIQLLRAAAQLDSLSLGGVNTAPFTFMPKSILRIHHWSQTCYWLWSQSKLKWMGYLKYESKTVYTCINICLGLYVYKWSDQERSVCFCMLIKGKKYIYIVYWLTVAYNIVKNFNLTTNVIF